MKTKSLLPLVLAVSIISLGGLSSAKAGAPSRATVRAGIMNFSPAVVTVRRGGTVTWVWHKTMPHDATAVRGSRVRWSTGRSVTSSQRRSSTVSFKSTGIFRYYCTAHTIMKGTVRVLS